MIWLLAAGDMVKSLPGPESHQTNLLISASPQRQTNAEGCRIFGDLDQLKSKYIVLVLISRLFYFLSSLRRGDQSTVLCIVSSVSYLLELLTYIGHVKILDSSRSYFGDFPSETTSNMGSKMLAIEL